MPVASEAFPQKNDSWKAGFKPLMQTLSAASFYLEHLDGRMPIVVITSLLSPQLSRTHVAQSDMNEPGLSRPPAALGDAGQGAAENTGLVDELMQLLDIG